MYFRGNENKKLWIIFLILQICGIIISLVLTIFTAFVLSIPQGYLSEIKENFNDYPLMDISSLCPSNQSQIIFGKWPGTVTGCDCLGRYPRSGSCRNRLCVGSCSVNETRAGCRKVYSRPEVKITIWKGKKLCSSTIRYNYEKLLENSVKEGEECPPDYKKCGKLDYMNNILCYPANQDCPINDLFIDQNSETLSSEYNYQTIPLDYGYYLHYTNKEIDKHVVRSIIKAGDELPCIDSSQYNDLGPYYKLNRGNGCTITYDKLKYNPYYKKMDWAVKYDVYQQNGIIQMVANLPLYPLSSLQNYNYSISQGQYLGFDKTCKNQHNFTSEILTKYESKFTTVKNLNISAFAFLIVSLIVMGFFGTFIFKESSELMNVLGFVSCGVILIVIILEGVAYFVPASIYLPSECADNISRPIMESITLSMKTIRLYLIIVFAFGIVHIILFLFDIPLEYIKDCIQHIKISSSSDNYTSTEAPMAAMTNTKYTDYTNSDFQSNTL